MYGTYWGFSLPLSTSAAFVASRPSVWPLASTTYHLRSISLPLGTKVPISLLPSLCLYHYQNCGAMRLCPRDLRTGHDFHPLPNKSVRVRICGLTPQLHMPHSQIGNDIQLIGD